MSTAGATDRESSADRGPVIRAVIADDDATTQILLRAVMRNSPASKWWGRRLMERVR